MKIEKIKVVNYKSFRDSDWIELSKSRTVIVGQNNSGKTAFLQSFRFGNNPSVPHRGPNQTIDTSRSPSFFVAEISISGSDLRTQAQIYNNQLFVPIPQGRDPKSFLDELWEKPEITFSVRTNSGGSFMPTKYPSFDVFLTNNNEMGTSIGYDSNASDFVVHSGSMGGDNLPNLLESMRHQNIYVFDPERLKIGACELQETSVLEPSARNLPSVLSVLMKNPSRWDRFKHHVREIFPSIREVSLSPLGNQIGVYIWQNEAQESTADYAVLLQECGTGVAQVLSILYVAMTRSNSVVVIDEPNSFLHPGAAKKLMNILRRYENNQYIISTHSPELIHIFAPDSLLYVSWHDGESYVERLDRRSLDSVEQILVDLGCELSDVFAADRVVWCEGPTEAKAFPLLALAAGINITTTKFLQLRATGDFEGRKTDAEAVIALYGIMSRGSSLLPRECRFNLDREGRSEAEIEDLSRCAGGRVKFLPARTFENYLVDAEAISEVLANDYRSSANDESAPTRHAIQEWLDENTTRFIVGQPKAGWELLQLDAPKLLNSLFSELTANCHVYRKIHHSAELSRWILINKPHLIDDLIAYIECLSVGS